MDLISSNNNQKSLLIGKILFISLSIYISIICLHLFIFCPLNNFFNWDEETWEDKDNEHYNFISIPKNINREIPIGKFHFGLDQSIIDYVEELPEDVFSILEKQFEYNQKMTK